MIPTVLAAVRSEAPWWLALLITALGALMLSQRQSLARQAEGAARALPLPPRLARVFGQVFKGSLVLIAGVWVLAGIGAFVLDVTGPIG